MARIDPQFNLRIPQEVKDRLVASARDNLRSLNAEVVFHLHRAFPQRADNRAGEVSDQSMTNGSKTRAVDF